MKYSSIKSLTTVADHSVKYRLCWRGEPSKKTNKFVGVYKGMVNPLVDTFSFALINSHTVNDIFSEDGEYMLVETKDGNERVILPKELKTLLTKERSNIVAEFHKFDREDGSMYPSCKDILDAIDKNIK